VKKNNETAGRGKADLDRVKWVLAGLCKQQSKSDAFAGMCASRKADVGYKIIQTNMTGKHCPEPGIDDGQN